MYWLKQYFKILFPSLLVAILPVIFFYNNNATKLNLKSIVLPLIIMVSIALCITAISMLFNKSFTSDAVLASIIFLLIFYFYGSVYGRLIILDIFQIEHATFLPIYIFLTYIGIKIIQYLYHLIRINIILGTELILGLLIIYNL